MRKYIYPILTVILIVGLFYAEKYVDTQEEAYPDTTNEVVKPSSDEFDTSLLPSSTTNAVVHHTYFSLSYSEAHEQAEWVAYPLLKSHLSYNEFDRPKFVEDRSVSTKSAHWRSYKNSGYDRGHLCPAGDRRFSYEAYHETFLTSNISPQNHEFNSGVWNYLEKRTRYWAKKKEGVYVITGGVLTLDLATIGIEKVAVPKYFYKIVMDASEGDTAAIAFLIPNEPTNKSYRDFVVPIDTIEAATGIDFFPKFSEEQQHALESTVRTNGWW